MANDNTLGAPTEGLGQTVTFAADGRQGVPQTSASNRQSLKLDARGGGAQRTSQALRVPEAQPDPTFQALAKMGGEMLRPHIEAERQVKYVEGMQRAAQGEAITEIVEEQPWYSKLFGSTSLVDGARAYSASAKATSIAVEMETKMDELRKLSPSEFAKYSADVLTKANTGDVPTDMLISQQIGSVLPQVMKSQAKAHLRYKQEVLDESIDASHTAGFASLGAVASAARQGGTTDDLDVLTNQLHLAGQLAPPPDVDREHYNKLLANSAVKSILSGNLDAAAFLDQTKILDSLSPQQQVAIKEATNRARSEARMKLPPEFADELASFLRAGNDGSSLDELKEKAKVFNERYKKYTGDPQDYFSAANLASEINQWHNTQAQLRAEAARRTASAATKVDKEAAALSQQAGIAAAMVQGGYVKNETADDKRMAWAMLGQQQTPEGLARTRAVQASMDNPDTAYADKLQSGILLAAATDGKTPGNPAALYAMYQEYKLLEKQGSAFAAQVYAGKGGKIMQAYDQIAAGQPATGTNIDIWFTRAVTKGMEPDAKLNAEDKKALTAEFTTGKFGAIYNAFVSESYAYKNPAGLAEDVASFVRTDLPPDVRAKKALADAKSAGRIDDLAGWHWRKLPGSSSFGDALRKDGTNANVNQTFDFAVEHYSKAVGMDTVSTVGQLVDDRGDPQMFLVGTGDDGSIKTTFFRASEVARLWADKQVKPKLPAPVIPALNPTERPLIKAFK